MTVANDLDQFYIAYPTILVYVNELTPYPGNYQNHPKEQVRGLADSLTSFQQFKPIVVWRCPKSETLPDGLELHEGLLYIICGHGLWQGAMEAGVDRLEAKDISGVSRETAEAILWADNASVLGAEPIADKLAALLDRTRHLTADKPGLAGMLAQLRARAGVNGHQPTRDVEPQIDKAAELAKVWGTALGQVWELGNHRLAVGDCTDRAVVEAVMRGEKADIEIHDPPYGMKLDTDWSAAKSRLDFAAENPFFGGKKHKPVIGDSEDYDPSFLFDRSLPKEMFLWGADYYAEKIPNRNDGSWLIWDKRLDDAGDRMYGSSFETCWSLSKHKRDFIRVKWAGIFGTEQEPDHCRLHPTQKPVLVYEWLLSRFSDENNISGDFYLGVGSHLIACENLGRKCRAIELDPGYAAVTLQRYFDLTSTRPHLLP